MNNKMFIYIYKADVKEINIIINNAWLDIGTNQIFQEKCSQLCLTVKYYTQLQCVENAPSFIFSETAAKFRNSKTNISKLETNFEKL